MNAGLERWCRLYAAHVGLEVPAEGYGGRLRERLSHWPAWGRLAAGAGAWLLLMIAAPLGERGREALLQRLQTASFLPVRALFMTVKAAVLPACYDAAR